MNKTENISERLVKRREYMKKYRQEHRKEINEQKKAHRKQLVLILSPEEYESRLCKKRAYFRAYRKRNREKMATKMRLYRQRHREKMRAYYKTYESKVRGSRCLTRLLTVFNGKHIVICGLIKRPYPNPQCCELCGQSNLKLKYHHWMNTATILASPRSVGNPLYVPGIWVCQPCDMFVHKLTDYPLLPQKWQILKQEAEGYITKIYSQRKGEMV